MRTGFFFQVMPPVPLNIPRQITPGDTLTWRDSFTDFLPPEYTLSWAIRGEVALSTTAIAVGDEFETTISKEQSATLPSGTYYFQAYLTASSGDRITIGSGQITVAANLETAAGSYDGSSSAQKMLIAVEAAIQARLTGGAVDSYEIRGRSLARTPLPDLVKLRDQLKIEVARQQAAAGLMPDARRLFVKFRGM